MGAAATPGTATITITNWGTNNRICEAIDINVSCVSSGESGGDLSFTIGGTTIDTPYPGFPNAASIAQYIANALNNTPGSPVTAAVVFGTSSLIMTSRITGTAANYPFSISFDDVDLTCSAVTNFTLTGGEPATPTDTGSVYVTVGGIPSTAVTWGATDTATSIAGKLATAITSTISTVTATNSGGTITLSSTGTGASTNYSYSVTPTDATGVSSFTFTPVTLASMGGGADAGTLGGGVYSYSLAGDLAPNGNLLGYTDSVMGTWTFNYDHLNRLTTANGPASVAMTYAYDSFGNRWPTNQSSATSWNQFTPQNQVPVGNGVSYDAAGNVISLAGLHSFTYDADNMTNSVDGSTNYLYDAEGRRVAKGTYSGSTFVASEKYLLGPGGEELTELNGSGNWTHSNVYAGGGLTATYDNLGLHFQLSDWLGTRRVQVSASTGQVDESCSSYPFGDNLNCSGPGTDATEQHFTGKQRDSETGFANGNDYFEARSYGSVTGRFTSPDPSGLYYADPGNPQSANLYTYALNNPLGFLDPSGLHVTCHEEHYNFRVTEQEDGGDITGGASQGTARERYCNDDGLEWQTTKVAPLPMPTLKINPIHLNSCSAAQQMAAQLAKAFKSTSDTTGWISFGAGVADAVSVAGEGFTLGGDTPVTIAITSVTTFFGTASTTTGGVAAMLNSFANGNTGAIQNFGWETLTKLAAKAAASKIPVIKPWADTIGDMTEKGEELAKKAKEVCP